MMRWLWWLVRGLVFSLVIFAILYLFVYLGVIPNLWEGYAEMFTIGSMIAVSVVCGFIFVTIKDIIFKKESKFKSNRR